MSTYTIDDARPDRSHIPQETTVDVASYPVGPATLLAIAGPCSIDTVERLVRVAKEIKAAGATMLRAGAFKPRTNPGSFQGHGDIGLTMLLEAKDETGMPVVTEVLGIRDLDAVLAVADMVQIGARNMQNTELLKEVGRTGVPVLLKRGLSATIDEVIGAVEYIVGEGNERVIVCERGIRTFEPAYRFTLDLAAVPLLKERTGRPVIVDPSHAPGRRDLVTCLSKAAVAVGADGLIVEVDENPDHALSDGLQQLRVEDFAGYLAEVRRVASGEGRRVLRASDREPAI